MTARAHEVARTVEGCGVHVLAEPCLARLLRSLRKRGAHALQLERRLVAELSDARPHEDRTLRVGEKRRAQRQISQNGREC